MSFLRMEPIDPDSLVTTAEAAELLGLAPATLKLWRRRGRGPTFVRVGSHTVRYRRRDLVAWIDAKTQQPARSVST